MKKKFKIKGLRPYVFSKPVEGQKVPKTDAQKTACAMERVYETNGKLFFPGRQIKGVIKSGATLQKIKMEKSSKRFIDYVKATLYIEPGDISFIIGKKTATIDDIQMIDYPVKTDNGKMVWARSAILPLPWSAEFEIILAVDALEMPSIINAIQAGGMLVGIGGKRPDYGLFEA